MTRHRVEMMMLAGITIPLYFLPTIFAFGRRLPSRWRVLAINLLLGFTNAGWMKAWNMADHDPGYRS